MNYDDEIRKLRAEVKELRERLDRLISPPIPLRLPEAARPTIAPPKGPWTESRK